ncbi:MAG TPA: hypothetical protein PLG77_12780, partial [Burkholderiaceae bacterium]|nr:hypothetical protein [Burkholderiaceae bacterium]
MSAVRTHRSSRFGTAVTGDTLRPLAAGLALAFASMLAQAQSLQELYDAARGYDATYLAARATAQAAQYRYEPAKALRLAGFILLFLQGISEIVKKIAVMRGLIPDTQATFSAH